MRANLLFPVLTAVSSCFLPACGSSQNLSYHLVENGCDTGEHSFSSKDAYCGGLADSGLNQGCAVGLRRQTFVQAECPGTFTSTTAAFTPAPRVNGPTPGPRSTRSTPDQVEVRTSFEKPLEPSPFRRDEGGVITFAGGRVTVGVATPEIDDFLSLDKAARTEVVRPAPGDCREPGISISFIASGIGANPSILSFSSLDPAGATACQDFVKAVAAEGIELRYTDVPLMNGHGTKVHTVILRVSVPAATPAPSPSR